MRVKYVAKALLLAVVLVGGSGFEHRETATAEPTTDTLASEITDQADPEFLALSDGDKCISMDDLMTYMKSQFPPQPECDPGMPEGHCQSNLDDYNSKTKATIAYAKTMHSYADRCVTGKEDGCIDEQEFVKMNEMEGPPPGFEEDAAEGMVDGDIEKPSEVPPCDMFDTNGDDKISKEELTTKAKELGEDDMSANFMANVYMDFMEKDGKPGLSCREYTNGIASIETEAGRDALADAMEKELVSQQEKVKEVECAMMDDNGDGMISQQEVYQYLSNIDGADLSQPTLDNIFKAADTDEDGFISMQECANAGKEYDGDGAEDNKKDKVGHDGSEKQSFLQLVPATGRKSPRKTPHHYKRPRNLMQLIADVKASPNIHWRPQFQWLLYRIPSMKTFVGFVKRRATMFARRLRLKPTFADANPHHTTGLK